MKKFLFAAFMLLQTAFCFAQTDPVRIEQNHIFQYIDKTLIPTGYLNECGPEVGNILHISQKNIHLYILESILHFSHIYIKLYNSSIKI